MKKSLLALACGAFAYGAAEFVMMGILPQAAHTMNVSIPTAGNFISAYAIGVCIGATMLVFGRKTGPKKLVLLFMAIALVGDVFSALAINAPLLIIGRFIAGLPHGAFFGTAALIAKTLAEPGKQAKAVSLTITGQTVANMLGVPAGTLLAEHLSWRLAFLILAGVAALTIVLVAAWVPYIQPVKDAGIAGQFRFLTKPGPWMILGATFTGNVGIFCWWSYVSPWLQQVGGYRSGTVPLLMMLAGSAMVIGGLIGGHITDRWRSAGTAALGQLVAAAGLMLVFLLPGSRLNTAVLTFIIAFALFFVSTPQQLLLAEAGKGGGELIGGAAVQIAFNFGNAVGSAVGGAALNASNMNYHFPALGGLPFAVIAVALLVWYSAKFETQTDALERMEVIEV
ncbi:MFS transporter, DHA1 family, arabinose polymer transporter [Bifidobacterium bohemicum]|uniref:AraJ-like protein n=1 Tax=Bifidobacterium bohemicum DSM 22767 TaxID=1437606 RepID=A0A086ZGQ4_9BIFI|nr:MFS transporter [Bifidobacterium bohemicum]KFI45704.1 AraJ-like protein [Bifidobacterium bohemicum DSM 22767]SCC07509.1 MFS transporter, DHA1 family, arabinose polymer transporter [Bifidobacterium bohemicum]